MWCCFIEVSLVCVSCVCLGFWRRGVGVTKEWQDVLRLMSHCVAAATLFALYVTLQKRIH